MSLHALCRDFSQYILDNCHRKVYLPQNGFADSLNASVASALCIQTLLGLYGERACGGLVRAATPAELKIIRTEWCRYLSRDQCATPAPAVSLPTQPGVFAASMMIVHVR